MRFLPVFFTLLAAVVTALLLATDALRTSANAGETTRVSVSSAGVQANWYSNRSSVSADGRYVAFDSDASNLVPGDTNQALDVFVHDRQTGTTTRVSVDSAGVQTTSLRVSRYPAISGDGRYVAFSSNANNLVAGDTNARYDTFVHDRQTSPPSPTAACRLVARSWNTRRAPLACRSRWCAPRKDTA